MKARLLVVLLVALGGCRMYGSQQSVASLEDAIRQEAVVWTAIRDGVKVEADALLGHAADDEVLAPLAEHLQRLADDYEVMATKMVSDAESASEGGGLLRSNPLAAWVGPDRYRSLHRVYGAMVAQRQVLADRYEVLRSELQAHVMGTGAMGLQEVARYQVAPPFYRRLEYAAQRQEMNDLLAIISANR